MKQAGRQAARLFGTWLHRVGLFILTLFLLLLLALGALAYRLSLGPLQIPHLASFLATTVSGQGISVQVSEAALAWGGYHQGGGAPLFLNLAGITVSNARHVRLAEIPDGRLVFSPTALFGGGAPSLVTSSDMRFNGSDVGVSMQAAIRLGLGLRLTRADLAFELGGGRLGAGGMSEPITGGGFRLHVTPHDVALLNGRLMLAAAGASKPMVTFAGALHLNTLWQGGLVVAGDQVQAGDLAAYWPPALASQARSWVLANILAGAACHLNFRFGLAVPRDFSTLAVTSGAGGLDADGVAVQWLAHATPITGLNGRLALLDLDTLLITAQGGALGGTRLTGGSMKITGLAQVTQYGHIKVNFAGKLADAIAVLNAPPLSLLRTAPPQIARATGGVTGMVVADLPLKTRIGLADVRLDINAALADVAVPLPLQGVGFTGGAVRLHAGNRGLTISGTAMLAGEMASIAARVDFQSARALQEFDLSTRLGPVLLEQAGLAADAGHGAGVAGVVPLTLHVAAGAGGVQTMTLKADLTPAAMGVPVLGWAKRQGQAGAVDTEATIDGAGTLIVRDVQAHASGLDVDGAWANDRLELRHFTVGGTEGQGTVTPPVAGGPWGVDLRGAELDARAILNPAPGAQAASNPPPSGPPSGPAWRARLDFAVLHLARGPAPYLRNFTFNGSGKGGAVLAAAAHAADAAGQPVDLAITPASADDAARHVHLEAADGGELLRALAAYDNLQGGALVLDGDEGAGDFKGMVTVSKFRLLQAPAIGKILQAATIYGAAEAASGPGLNFDRLVAPFDVARQVLTLKGARAYSASLGFTVSGTIGLVLGDADLNATIVPAYALNALPGKIPVIGKLFSAEAGGGLFAVRAKITGPLTDPKVSVNPLSALTPGFLRNVFGAAPAGPGAK